MFWEYLLEKRSVLEKLDLEVLSVYGVFYAKNAGYTVKLDVRASSYGHVKICEPSKSVNLLDM